MSALPRQPKDTDREGRVSSCPSPQPDLAAVVGHLDPELEQAWTDVHANTPVGWQVDQPVWENENHRWSMYAFDPTERPFVGKRSREWTALGETELDCVRRMAYCLGELKAGRWPK